MDPKIIEHRKFGEFYPDENNSLQRSISNFIRSYEISKIEPESSNIQPTLQLSIEEIYRLDSTFSKYERFKNFCIEAGMILSKSF